MECRRCASPLSRPGDYCLVCHTPNTEQVVLSISSERTTVHCLQDDKLIADRTVTTVPESNTEHVPAARRNYAGRIADEVRRKRPEAVYVSGERSIIQDIRAELRFPIYRVDADNPVDAVMNQQEKDPLEVVSISARDKIGGSHTTVIGGRTGQQILHLVAKHPHVKKVIPGPIDAGGSGSQSGIRAKATRADTNGNIRLLLRDGSSVQENRIVTTAPDRTQGERIRDDLNEALFEEGFQQS